MAERVDNLSLHNISVAFLHRDVSGKKGQEIIEWIENNCSGKFEFPESELHKYFDTNIQKACSKEIYKWPIIIYFENEEDRDNFKFWYTLRYE